jgi:hypothetical protein
MNLGKVVVSQVRARDGVKGWIASGGVQRTEKDIRDRQMIPIIDDLLERQDNTARPSRNQIVARAGTSVICEARALVLEVIPAKLVPAKAESGNPVSKRVELRSGRTGFPRPAGGMTDLLIPVVFRMTPLPASELQG